MRRKRDNSALGAVMVGVRMEVESPFHESTVLTDEPLIQALDSELNTGGGR